MQRHSLFCLALVACFAVQVHADDKAAAHPHATGTGSPWGMLDEYCTECHNTVDWAGGVAFDAMSPETIPDEAEVFEATIRKLRGHLMPPPGSKQPDQKRIDEYVGWMEQTLDSARSRPRAGHVPVQRLNRTEYANAVRSLVGVEVKVEELLPRDIDVDGFDNIAAALTVSPAFLDQYISAARFVAKQAVGEPKVVSATYGIPARQGDGYIDGFPLGTRGGVKFMHNFPADGEYRFSVLDLGIGLYSAAGAERVTLVILVDGKEVIRGQVGGPEDLALADREGADGRKKIMDRFTNMPAQIKAGTHEVVVTFIERARSEGDETVAGGSNTFSGFGGGLRQPRVDDGVQIVGPFNPTGVSQTASRKLIFVCEPKTASEERACAEKIAENLARRAYRRPVTKEDIDALMPFYEAGRKESFDGGIRQVVTAVLASPDFLYRGILPPATPDAPAHPLTDVELASRLSFFLWSQGPDDELLAAATSGDLRKPEVMEKQVRRMLADPRAGTLVTSFGMKWLNVDDLDAVDPDPRQFPGYSAALRQDFAKEIELFMRDVLLERDQNILTLLTENHTYLNERLAQNYGIKDVRGPQFRRVELKDPNRFGLLGKSAVLLRTSYADRTSPVLRGAWVMERLLGAPPTPPPPGVETNLSNKEGEKPKTIRARLEQHRTVKSCNQCHGVIDPIGIALENFDVTGQWRKVDREAQEPIDASSLLPSGIAVDGPVQLREALLRKPDLIVTAFTEKLMMYGLGRELEYYDMPQVRAIVNNAKKDDYRLSALVLGIVNSDAFRMQSPPHERKKTEHKTASAN